LAFGNSLLVDKIQFVKIVNVNHLAVDPEEVGTQRKFSKIKGQKLMAKSVFLVEAIQMSSKE